MSVMKMGGKSDSNTVVGVSVSDDGRVRTEKTWRNDVVLITDVLPTAAVSALEGLDVSDAAAVSLRFRNTTGLSFSVGFYADHISNNYVLFASDGSQISYKIPASANNVIVTPDDMKELQWLKNIRLRIAFSEVPTSGEFKVYAVIKR